MYRLTLLQVTFSMLEIYNEQARDLLNKEKPPPGGLKVRECAKRGFYRRTLCTTVCVRACVRAGVRAWACVCVCLCARACVRACVRACT